MKTRILAIGSRPDDWVRAGVDTYLERLPAHLKPELVEIPLSLRSSGVTPPSPGPRKDSASCNA